MFGGCRAVVVALCIFQRAIQSLICCRAAAATANPRHQWIIRNAEGIETMAHRGQPSWAGRLPVHRLQFRFAILNSPEDEYALREAHGRTIMFESVGRKKIDAISVTINYPVNFVKANKSTLLYSWKFTWKRTHIHSHTSSKTKVFFFEIYELTKYKRNW